MKLVLVTTSLVALVCAVPSLAQAQEEGVERVNSQTGDDEDEARQKKVVVTGSAIRGTPEDAALPVEVFSRLDLEREGSPTALEFAKELTISGPTNGEANYFGGGPRLGAPIFNLRSLGEERTLTLLNGRRMSQNLSNIPSIALDRTEVLKDGAAVIYGADAVGGVVNFITRDSFTGVEGKANYKYIDGSDGDWDVGLLVGIGEGDTNLMASAEWEHRSRLETEERSFSSLPYGQNPSAWSFLTNLALYYPKTAGDSFLGGAIPDFSQSGCESQGGIFDPTAPGGAACHYGYAPYYNLVEDQDIFRGYVQLNSKITDTMNFHGEVAYGQVDVPHQFNSPSLPTTRGPAPTTGATFQYEVPLTNPFAQAFADRTGWSGSPLFGFTDHFDILLLRPFAHGGNAAMGRGEGNSNAASIDNQVWRVSAGINGTLGDSFGAFSDVGYDFAVTYNRSEFAYQDADYLGFRLQEALNGFGGPLCEAADLDPLTPGTQNPGAAGTNNCLYFNPFGTSYPEQPELGLPNPAYVPGTENPDALVRWLFDPRINETLTQNLTFDLVFNGMSGIQLPGGEIGWAVGAQSRQIEEYEYIPSEFYNGATQCPYPGTSNCPGEFGQGPFGFYGIDEPEYLDQQGYSLFVETSLPVLDNLNFQAAVRREEFSGGLGSTVYKVSGKWQVFEPLAIRASYGTNFVAPPVGLSPGQVDQVVRSYTVAGGAWLSGTTVTRSDVEPEEATALNIGAIWQSRGFAPDHDISLIVDYFDIELEGEIDELASHSNIASAVFDAATRLADCSSPFIDRITFNDDPVNSPGGMCVQGSTGVAQLNNVRTDFGNGADRYTSGIDIQASYSLPLAGNDFTLGMTGTRILELETSDLMLDGLVLAPGQDLLGNLNFSSIGFAAPEWRVNAYANYRMANQNIRLTARYVSSLDDDRGPITPAGYMPGTTDPFPVLDISKVDSSLTFDATYLYDLNDTWQFTATVENITDEDPPFVRNEFGYDPRIANPLGRTLEVGVKATF